MKNSSLRPFAAFAALRFKCFPSTPHALGYKWADRAGQPYRISARLLRVLRTSAFRFIQTFKNANPLRVLCVLCGFAVASIASAATVWTSPTWSVATTIPDNNDVGFSDTRTINIPGMDEIESVTVHLSFTGGWNGDLYAYLVHDSGFSVLLNRPGRSLVAPDGAATAGMDITFDDSAVADIHTAIPMSGGAVTGTYQPDGRTTDPLSVLNTDPRTAMLSSFTGLNPNGNWTLFVADQSPGDTSTLQSWSMSITAVPEPSAALLVLFSSAALLRRRR